MSSAEISFWPLPVTSPPWALMILTERQVKVRGVRIQPEEIEARLKRFAAPDGATPVKASCLPPLPAPNLGHEWAHAAAPPASRLDVPKACLAVPTATPPVELVAFVETAPGVGVDVGALRAHLVQELG